MKNSHLRALGIGEILWDILPEGKKLGGAPTNFAFHSNQFDLESAIVSSVGRDELGHEIMDDINSTDIVNCISYNDKPTGTVSVKLDKEGIPTYIIHEDVAWDAIEISTEAMEFARTVDTVCFGSLAQRNETSRKAIYSLLDQIPTSTLKIFDINIRQHFYSREVIESSLEYASVLKINEEEIVLFVEMFGMSGDEFSIIDQIISRFGLDYLALTKGSNGSWLASRNRHSFLETPRVKVVDTVGAGDSFTAAMAAGILHENDLSDIHRLAVDISAFVCTQEGATPTLPDELKNRVRSK
jgi:fructokinase